MPIRTVEAGHEYRLVRDFEIRDLSTGTMRAFVRGGEKVKVKKVEPDLDQMWLEGVSVYVPISAFVQVAAPGDSEPNQT